MEITVLQDTKYKWQTSVQNNIAIIILIEFYNHFILSVGDLRRLMGLCNGYCLCRYWTWSFSANLINQSNFIHTLFR